MTAAPKIIRASRVDSLLEIFEDTGSDAHTGRAKRCADENVRKPAFLGRK